MTARIALTALIAVLGAATAPASELLRNELRDTIAKKVQQTLAEEKQSAVAIGEFTGPAQLDTNATAGIQQLLADELTALGVRIDKGADLSVKGRYAKVEDKDSPGQITVKITAEILNRNDERLGEISAVLRGVGDIARLLALTAVLPPLDEPGAAKQRNRELNDRAGRPQAFIQGTQVRAAEDSPYAVELLVRPRAGAPAAARAAESVKGAAFVGIRRDELYEVRAINHTGTEAGVTVTVDGLDVFAFSEVRDPKTGRPKYSHYIVPAAKGDRPGASTVVGWHLRDAPPDNYASFLVTAFGQGASRRAVAVPKQGKPGVVTVTFAPVQNGARSAADETGFGPPISVKVEPVKRTIGPVREIVSVRYTAE